MLLQRLEPETLSRVHNLFLSDDVHPAKNTSPATDRTNRPGTKDASSITPASLTRTPSLPNKTVNTLTRLLTLCGPSLRVLSVAITSSSSPTLFARLFRMQFPELCSLSISGYYPFPSTPNVFPKVRTMKLHGNPNPSGLLAMGTLEDACPLLDTLEVRGVKRSSCFVGEVERAVCMEILAQGSDSDSLREVDSSFRGLDDEQEAFPPRLPKTVRTIVIQSLADANTNPPTTLGVPLMPAKAHGVHMSLLPPAQTTSIDELRKAWMSASSGAGW
ncbi:hypothetical protein D9619_013509 [Psilocybe cf. subviscida]|uniref:Uncharacterized protein n=1 Tax=Psilocybe cf. subviscida TaxID=2480587 RepID=A0A8H5BH94_9AGAR|nr:hypothetical protein D9619_013509 [Psilocybe cf. subviscida]